MNFQTSRPRFATMSLLLLLTTSQFACTHQDYRVEVVPGQQGQAEVRRIPFTAEEQAARDREEKVRAALGDKSDEAMASDLATLEGLWPKLSAADRAEIMNRATRAASKQ